MRIVLITPEYPPAERMGGIGTNALTVARALVRAGHEVGVVTRGEEHARYTDEGVEVVRLDHRWLPHPGAARLLANGRIAVAARSWRPDVVQAAEWEAEAWSLARFGRVPVVTRLATPTYMIEELNFGGARPESKLVRRLERDQTRRSAKVFAPTRAIVDRVGTDWGLALDEIETIPNPLDLAEVRRLAEGPPPVEVAPRSLVFFGRMERRKGIETLARALPAVLAAHPDVEAYFVGRDPGDEEGALMERFRRIVAPVEDRVHLLGELPRAETMALVARATIVVVPSLWESFGYVCVEAMALGRPVVAARAGGLAEIVTDGVDGWLVPPGDAESLAGSLVARLSDADELDRVGEAARARAEDFDVDRIVNRLLDVYQRACRGAGERFDEGIYARGYRRYFHPDDRRDPFHRLYEAKRTSVLAGLARPPRRRLLDVGGGYGRLAGPLAAQHDVTLVDISPEMLAEARGRWPRLTVVQADARELPFADDEFDALLALDLLPHLPDAAAGLLELARVVRPEGMLVFDTTNDSPWWVPAYPAYVNWRPRRLLRTMLAGGVLPEWRLIVRHHAPGEVEPAIDGAGLRLERREAFGPPWSAKWHLWWTVKRPS